MTTDTPLLKPALHRRRIVLGVVGIRLLVVSIFFSTAVLFHLLSDNPFPLLRPLFFLILCVYAASLVYILVYRFLDKLAASNIFLMGQLGGDVCAVTYVVYFTGALESSFSFMYHLIIVTSGLLLLSRRNAMITALLSSVAYIGMVDLIYYGVIPPYGGSIIFPGKWVLYYFLGINTSGFFLLALLSGLLTERIKVRDVALEKTSSQLADLRLFHESVIDSMGSGLLTTDPYGRITFANRASLRLLDLPFNKILGKPAEDLLPGSIEAATASLGHLEVHVTREGRDRVFGVGSSSWLDRHETLQGHIVVFEDLTETAALEKQLRLKERMAALGEMAAGLAHEIRNPLAAVRGSAQLLERDLSPVLNKDQKRLFQVIVKETVRLNNTIETFLGFARGGQSAEDQNVLMLPLLEEILELLKHSNYFKPTHHLSISNLADEPMVKGHPDRLKQVFWNLSLNALQAMPEGGVLEIELSITQDKLAIHFLDSGCGFPENENERMFMPFQGHFHEGVGLGLAIAYRIVEDHKGTLRALPRQNGGTDMILELPLLPPPSEVTKVAHYA